MSKCGGLNQTFRPGIRDEMGNNKINFKRADFAPGGETPRRKLWQTRRTLPYSGGVPKADG